MVGRSPALLALRRRIEMVAPTEATVLILGERGTGKELVADAIREGSRRRAGPFIKVNCAALPGELLAGELFGHERGAFTGAHERREGLLAAAHGGTVFLDEIGDLSPSGQAMLLRFLQEREVRLIGVRQTYRVDVRVIAATNKGLDEAIGRGEFRADLYDRLHEVVVEVPPLRERREDIPLLVDHFLQGATVRHGRPRPTLGPEARRALLRYDWPGNVRELEQTLSAAVIFADANPIQVWQLSFGPGRAVRSSSRGSELIQQETAGRAEGPPRVASVDAVGSGCVSDRQRMALQFVADAGAVSRRDLVRRLGVSRETARLELARLVAAKLLRRVGAAGRWVQYVSADPRS
jgi:DNA-binding NtrC family response regulator